MQGRRLPPRVCEGGRSIDAGAGAGPCRQLGELNGDLYPSPAAVRSVLWLGLVEGGMSHQLAFIFGPYGEAHGAHEAYTSQVGQFGRELAPLLPAIHRSVASNEPPHPGTNVTGEGSLGFSSRAWRLGAAANRNLTIHAVVVNLSPEVVAISLAVGAPELLDGRWSSPHCSRPARRAERHAGRQRHGCVFHRGGLLAL